MMGLVVIDNVAIPLTLNDRFIAPDLERALEYYPDFARFSSLEARAFLSCILREIDKIHPNGYTSDKAIGELLWYVGPTRFMELLEQKGTGAERRKRHGEAQKAQETALPA